MFCMLSDVFSKGVDDGCCNMIALQTIVAVSIDCLNCQDE